MKRITSLTSNTAAVHSELYCVLTSTAIWSGNFLVFYNNLGRQLVRHQQQDNLILFCFGATVVYTTPSKLQKSYLQILSALLQNWIFFSGSCHHLLRSCCVLLVTVAISYNLTLYYKAIKSGY